MGQEFLAGGRKRGGDAMKWLARMRVPYDVAAKNKLRDGYDWHQALWLAFPGRDDEARDFLTRVDRKEREFIAYLLSVLKPACPPWCPPEYWELAEIGKGFLSYNYYRFDLIANPTRSVAKIGANGERTKNGRREALLKTDKQIEWLKRKAEQGGFLVIDEPPLEIGKPLRLAFEHNQGAGSHFSVNFKGILKVTNHSLFIETFRRGIGSAKGFGFGMLMLQPVSL
jgi:CRISPR system Cascade subunit CasE